ncbi:MAG: FeoA family protein [Neisseriaceae bacterium]
MHTTLDQLAQHQRAFIRGFKPEQMGTRRKLLAMGITPGCEVELIRIAPLGDPLQIRVRGFQLCLRQREAALILVEI